MKLQAVKDDATDQNFREVKGRFPIQAGDVAGSAKELFLNLATSGTFKVDFGVTKVKFSASKFSPNFSVAHDLGTASIFPVAISNNAAVNVALVSATSTEITFAASNWFGAETTEPSVFWIAIG